MGPRKSYTEEVILICYFQRWRDILQGYKNEKKKNILGRESSVNQKTGSVN